MTELSIGVDISKAYLEAASFPDGRQARFPNDAGLRALRRSDRPRGQHRPAGLRADRPLSSRPRTDLRRLAARWGEPAASPPLRRGLRHPRQNRCARRADAGADGRPARPRAGAADLRGAAGAARPAAGPHRARPRPPAPAAAPAGGAPAPPEAALRPLASRGRPPDRRHRGGDRDPHRRRLGPGRAPPHPGLGARPRALRGSCVHRRHARTRPPPGAAGGGARGARTDDPPVRAMVRAKARIRAGGMACGRRSTCPP